MTPVRSSGPVAGTRPWVLAALAATLVLLLAHAWSLRFLTDDSFISFRYARNLADGAGLVFNPGHERVEGYTNFLWVVILAGLDRIGIAPDVAATPLTLLLTVVLWSLVAWFALRQAAGGGPAWAAVVPPLLLAATRSVAVWSTSGLETRLLECLVLGGALRLTVECERTGRGAPAGFPWSGILLGLAALTRPDAVLISGCALAAGGAWCALRRRVIVREHAVRVSVWAAIVAAHLGFRLAYYGSWVPNTYWAKVSNQSWWEMGATYFAAWSVEYLMVLWLPAIALAIRGELRRGPSAFLLIAAAVVIPHAVGIAAIGGDHFEYRPLDLYFPFAYLVIGSGIAALAAQFPRWRLAPAYVALLLIGISWLPFETRRQFPEGYRPRFPGWGIESAGVGRFLEPEHTWFGRLPGARQALELYSHLLRTMTDHMVGTRREELRMFLAQTERYADRLQRLVASGALPQDTHIAIGAVGLIPYRTNLRTLDRLGLTDETVARQEPRSGKRIMAHEKSATIDYGRAMGVDLWAKHPSTPLRHVTDRAFMKMLWPAGGPEGSTWLAAAGDGYYLVVEFPQGEAAARARFPRLDWKRADDPAVRAQVLAEAVAALEARVNADAFDAQAFLRLGNAYLDAQQPALAVPYLERAASLRPYEVYTQVRAGMAYARMGDFASAIRHQESALGHAEELGDGPELTAIANDLALLREEARNAAAAAAKPAVAALAR